MHPDRGHQRYGSRRVTGRTGGRLDAQVHLSCSPVRADKRRDGTSVQQGWLEDRILKAGGGLRLDALILREVWNAQRNAQSLRLRTAVAQRHQFRLVRVQGAIHHPRRTPCDERIAGAGGGELIVGIRGLILAIEMGTRAHIADGTSQQENERHSQREIPSAHPPNSASPCPTAATRRRPRSTGAADTALARRIVRSD
jgi:hypothetical protein